MGKEEKGHQRTCMMDTWTKPKGSGDHVREVEMVGAERSGVGKKQTTLFEQ